MSWFKKSRKPKVSADETDDRAGWECLVCGHREYCIEKKTFWQDIGRTLFTHRNQHHPDGQDYVMHVPTRWERGKDRKQ